MQFVLGCHQWRQPRCLHVEEQQNSGSMYSGLQRWYKLWIYLCSNVQGSTLGMSLSGFYIGYVRFFFKNTCRKIVLLDVRAMVTIVICLRRRLSWRFTPGLQTDQFLFNLMVSLYGIAHGPCAIVSKIVHVPFQAESLRILNFNWMTILRSIVLAQLPWMVNYLYSVVQLQIKIKKDRSILKISIYSHIHI